MMNRRDALELIGLSAAAAAFPTGTSAQAQSFPKGAVIRTLFKDYAPEELAGGATLFHEHMSLAPDFMVRFFAATAAARAANGLPPVGGAARGGDGRAGGAPATPPPNPQQDVDLMTAELSAARREGVACIVDAGQIGRAHV